MSERKPFEYTIITVEIFARIQDNGDGTWTAVACLGDMELAPVTRETRGLALAGAQKLATIQPVNLNQYGDGR